MESQIFKRAPHVAWRDIEGETIIVDPKEGEVRGVNEVAALIWEAIDGKRDVNEIVQHVRDEFEVGVDQARQDTIDYLSALENEGLILVCPPQ